MRPLDYISYNKEEASKKLVQKYGFKVYPQKHFESRFTRFYESYWWYERFGYDTRRVQFSSLILTDQMSRNEAIDRLKEKPYNDEDIHHDYEYIANKLEISVDELDKYFRSPLKSYKDYKNQEFVYEIGSRVMRFLGKEKGGKR